MLTIVSVTSGTGNGPSDLAAAQAGDVIVFIGACALGTSVAPHVVENTFGTKFTTKHIIAQTVSSANILTALVAVVPSAGTPNITITWPSATNGWAAYILRGAHTNFDGWMWRHTNTTSIQNTINTQGLDGIWIAAYSCTSGDRYSAMRGGGTLDVRSVGSVNACGSLVVAAGGAVDAGIDLTAAATADLGLVVFIPDAPGQATGGAYTDRYRFTRSGRIGISASTVQFLRGNHYSAESERDFGLRDDIEDNFTRLN